MSAAAPRTWIARYQLLLFFVLTYLITMASAQASRVWPDLPMAVWWIPMVFSPTIVAVCLTGLVDGSKAVKALLLRLVQWKVGSFWYLAASALFWLPLLMALVYMALGNPVPGLKEGMTPWLLLYALVFNVYSGPLAEETGWRGFALPRLQARFNALTSSLILGVIHACWHLPFYATSGGGVGIPFPAYLALVIVLTIFITWIYNNTGGSLLLTVLAHFSFNACSSFIPGYLGLMPPMVFYIAASVGLTSLVVGVVWYYGPSKLVRQGRRIAA